MNNEMPSSVADVADKSAGSLEDSKVTDLYAILHRELEHGRVDDDLLTRLISVCIQLDKRDEAVQLFGRVESPPVRRGLRRDLARHGWVSAEADAAEKDDLCVVESDPTIGDRYSDAVQHLAEGQMPIAAIGGTIAFPVVLALGGLLAGIHDSAPFLVLAALPGLLLVGVTAVIGRRVLLTGMQDLLDPEPLPPRATFIRETPIVLTQLLIGLGIFCGPAIVALLVGHWIAALPLLLAALFLMPMAVSLVLVTSDWSNLRPRRIFAAMRAGGASYGRTFLATLPLAIPGSAAFVLTADMPFYTALTIIGPLSVVPSWLAARMLGRYFHRHAASFAAWKLPTEAGSPCPESHWPRRQERKLRTRPQPTRTRRAPPPADRQETRKKKAPAGQPSGRRAYAPGRGPK